MGSSTVSAAKAKTPARSRATRWRIGVLLLVHVIFAVHIGHYISTGRTISPLEPSEAMEFAKRSTINAGFVFFGLTLVSTLILGRFFCGWACHVVALQDLCRALMLRLGITPRPLRSRWLALVPILAAGYMFAYPLIYRWWVHGYNTPRAHMISDDFWATFPGPIVTVATFLVCGFAAVFFLGSKGFCTYGCPYGAVFGAMDRLAPGRIRVTDACEGCHHCTQVCTSNVDVGREVHDYGMVVDPGCMKCMDCVSVCPTDALYFGLGRPALGAKPRVERKPKRRRLPNSEEAVLALGFALTFFAVRGLYGHVPFLMSLGVAMTGALLSLRAVQLLTRPKVRLVQWDLKQDGRLTTAGKGFALFALVGLGALTHSLAIQGAGWISKSEFAGLEKARADWFVFPRRPLTQGEVSAATSTRKAADRALRWGWIQDARRLEERGWAQVIAGQPVAGMADLRASRDAAPRRSNLSVELGHLARSTGDLDQALLDYTRALGAFPASQEIRQYIVGLCMERQDLESALRILGELEPKRPWDAPLLDRIGSLRLAMGDVDGGSRDLRRAHELEPENPGIRAKLIQVYQAQAQDQAAQGDSTRAHESASKALALRPDDPSLVHWAANFPSGL